MKLILTRQVTNLGDAGDVVEVKNGYGRNYLIPRGFAITWSRGAASQIESIKRAREVREVRDLGHAQELKQELEKLTPSVAATAGEGGQLYGRVTAKEVAQAIRAAGGPDIDWHIVSLPTPIKAVGEHQVAVELHADVVANLPLVVKSK